MVVASTAIDAVRVGSSEAAAVYLGADSVWTASAPGMVLINPSSIAYSGTSATTGANGQVTFTAVTSLSLNGVFSADFDNYVLSARYDASASLTLRARFRASGTDNSTASSYVIQSIQAAGTSVSGSRNTQDYANMAFGWGPQRNGSHVSFYGPFLAQPTAARSVSGMDYASAIIEDTAFTHNQSVSYDGLTVYIVGGNITGALQVYGVRS